MTPSKDKVPQAIQKELITREISRRSLFDFTRYTLQTFTAKDFHTTYYKILDMFAKSTNGQGDLRRVIVTVPPQHGKSECSTRRLPPFLLGHNPNLKIAVASYNQTFVRKFSRDNRRILKGREYRNLFPNTRYPEPTDSDYARGLDEFEIPNSVGSVRFVGRGGPLTGSPVDVAIMDDLYKDYAEGNSPVIRESVIDWYTSVVRTRLHNNSSQLIVFTRWHEEDLIGYLEKEEKVVTITSWEDLENPDPYTWYKINFPAIQNQEPNEIDPRFEGDSLWPEKHSLRKLTSEKELDAEKFESLYQGNPRPLEGLLYSKFDTYDQEPKRRRFVGSYVDTADMGADWLCSLVYVLGKDGYIYITDIVYTNVAMEETERLVAEQHHRRQVDIGDFESNNGGRGFCRSVERICRETHKYTSCQWNAFHQSGNKESRILSNSANLQKYILFPSNWSLRWPKFYTDIMRFRKNFKANTHDDCADALTGVWEKCFKWVDQKNSSLYEW